MPQYRYQCRKCKKIYSVFRKMRDPEVAVVCCDRSAIRLYENYICTNPFAWREENKMSHISKEEMLRLNREWDKRREEEETSVPDPPPRPAPDSLARLFAEKGLIQN